MAVIDLTPGSEIPTFVRQQNFHAWNRFAAVNDEFVFDLQRSTRKRLIECALQCSIEQSAYLSIL